MKIDEYNLNEISNQSTIKENEVDIKKFGMDSFLKSKGIFIEIIPFYQHPNDGGKLINVSFEIQYWTDKKDERHWNLGYYEERNGFINMKEATTKAILKSFELIELRKKSIMYLT